MRIGIDAMGGDYSPLEAVKGAASASILHPQWRMVLYGIKSEIESVCVSEGIAANSLSLEALAT